MYRQGALPPLGPWAVALPNLRPPPEMPLDEEPKYSKFSRRKRSGSAALAKAST